MEWRDVGVLLSAQAYGERALLLDVLTAEHGRWSGVARGAATPRRAAEFQIGATLALVWRARLEEHLGQYRAEGIAAPAARLLDRPFALAALASAAALLTTFTPERDPQPQLYAATQALIKALADEARAPAAYALWELGLLDALGFGLDLAHCAATGATQDLVWVSPRSGRAVSRQAGAPYAEKLLALPAFLRLGDDGPQPGEDLRAALALTGAFLERRVAPSLGLPGPPPARAQLAIRAERLP